MHVCLCDKGRCCLGRIIKKRGGGTALRSVLVGIYMHTNALKHSRRPTSQAGDDCIWNRLTPSHTHTHTHRNSEPACR